MNQPNLTLLVTLGLIDIFIEFSKGILRVLDDLDDICLDVPNAAQYLERLGGKCKTVGLIDDALLQKIPARGRKRFVSEGDGGRVKE